MSPQITLNREIITGPAKNRKQAFRELAQVVADSGRRPKKKASIRCPRAR